MLEQSIPVLLLLFTSKNFYKSWGRDTCMYEVLKSFKRLETLLTDTEILNDTPYCLYTDTSGVWHGPGVIYEFRSIDITYLR